MECPECNSEMEYQEDTSDGFEWYICLNSECGRELYYPLPDENGE